MPDDQTRKSAGRLFITGGAGFLGAAIAARASKTWDVTVFDNFARDSLRFLDRPVAARLHVVRGDVGSRASLTEAAAGADVILHLAAIAGVPRYYEAPYDVMRVNLRGTMNLLDAVESSPPKRLIYFSTSEVYGDKARNANEDNALVAGHYAEPRWVYAVSKIAAEKAAFMWGRQNGVDVTSLRPFNVFGPGQTGDGAVHDMILSALYGQDVVVHGGGRQRRAWCYLDDFVDAAMASLVAENIAGEAINVGNPENDVSVRELADIILKLVDGRSALRDETHFGADVKDRSPNIDKARRLLGFEPRVDLRSGLKKTIDWYRAHAK
ncbi:NAD-dependent epimerase/dehydratase family protein [bacterium]|nr:NAD-dependent epimerase/dehydratase family protein [bacterium]